MASREGRNRRFHRSLLTSGNYWGTTDAAQIAAWIDDYINHPPMDNYHYVIVDFEPFITSTPVPEAPAAGGLQLKARPTPFNPSTTFHFSMDAAGHGICAVYDLRGRQLAVLADRDFDAGDHEIVWDGKDGSGHVVAAGTYVVQLVTDTATDRIAVSLVK